MSITFDTVQPADAPALKQFMAEVIGYSVVSEGPARKDMVDNVSGNVDWWLSNSEQSIHLKATAEGAIVGVVLVKNFWNLCSLFVAPSLQRQGIGSALMRMAIGECRNKSPKGAIWLNAAPGAVVFYTRLGFSPRMPTQQLPSGFVAMGLAL